MVLRQFKERLNNIYEDETISYDNIIKRMLSMVKERPTKEDFSCYLKMSAVKKQSHTGEKIKVVFIFQMPALWSKQSGIYEEMKKRENIEVTILSVPEYDIRTKQHNLKENIAYEYAIENNIATAVNALEPGGWKCLRELHPDYVFYQRPYEEYLPEIYRAKEVCAYAKTCYVPYAYFLTTSGEMRLDYGRGFARNIYMNFVTSKDAERKVRDKFRITHKLGVKKVKYLGAPILEEIFKTKQNHNEISVWKNWGCKQEQFKILWTPRWTMDEKIGGSHYFDYDDNFLKLLKENEDMFLAFRPHPLAFANYIREGLMSESEIENLEQMYNKSHNMVIDHRAGYMDTFWASDLLVTDISSMAVEYFVTGKPIIMCDTKLSLSPLFEDLISCMYWAKNWSEVENIILNLKQGNDVLKSKREEAVQKLYEENSNSSKRIVEFIEKDFYKK